MSTTAVVLVRHNTGVEVTIDSISMGGARFVGPLTVAIGERVQILFEIEETPVEVTAEVVRVEHDNITIDRFAARFVDLDANVRLRIRSLVLKSLHQDGTFAEARDTHE